MKADIMKKFLLALVFAPTIALAAGAAVHLDKAPDVQGDKAALQNGARVFVNYCMNCHGLSFVRYNRLTEFGLSEQQVIENLMFTADKIGDPMRVAARAAEQKQWFGAAPPDLTLVARARASADGSGADWLYTYLRSFYRDEKRPNGWNNTLFPNASMPNPLWELQGVQQPVYGKKTATGDLPVEGFTISQPGRQSPEQFNQTVRDITAFLEYAGEPAALKRQDIGVWVIFFLVFLALLAWMLKNEYWRDVH